MTYRSDGVQATDEKVSRDWATTVRARQNFGFGDYYIETGWDMLYDQGEY